MNAELIKRMVKSYKAQDHEAFVAAVRKLAHAERRQGHKRVAEELERMLSNGLSTGRPTDAASTVDRAPRSKSEGATMIDVRRSSRTLDDIVLEPECGQRLSRFLEEFSHRSLLAEHGLPPKRKLLFFGPPGNGKTMCAEVIAGELDLPPVLRPLRRFGRLVPGRDGGQSAPGLRLRRQGIGGVVFRRSRCDCQEPR